MRVTQIYCDRCGLEIEDLPAKLIPGYVDRETGDFSQTIADPYDQAGLDYCTDCVAAIVDFANTKPSVLTAMAEPDEQLPEPPAPASQDEIDSSAKKVGRKRTVDVGKIFALHDAGWPSKEIAIEMHMTPKAISNVLYQYKNRMEKENG